MTGWAITAQQLTLPGFALAAVLLGLVAFIRVWPQLQQIKASSDASLRTDLLARVGALEESLKQAYARIALLEKMLTHKESAHAAALGDVQHDLANEQASFEALLLMAETNPEKLPEMLPRIREDRRQHRERMALKRGAREGAQMQEQAQ